MLTHAWIIPLIPAISFLIILGFGSSCRGGSEVGIASVAICFVLALTVAAGWIGRVNHPPVEHTSAKTEASATHGGAEGEAAPASEGEAAPAAEAAL